MLPLLVPPNFYRLREATRNAREDRALATRTALVGVTLVETLGSSASSYDGLLSARRHVWRKGPLDATSARALPAES